MNADLTDDILAEPGDPAAVAQERLGDPDAVFAVSPGRFWAKFAVGLALLAYGVIANAVAWNLGHWRVDHVTLLILFAPPITGLSLLRHLYANRGLRVLVYPTGLLRVQRDAAEAYPWDEVTAVAVRADQAAAVALTDGDQVTDAWLTIATPIFRIGTAGVVVLRADGVSAVLSPAIADFADLAERIQRATFRHLWPEFWAHFRAGGAVGFGGFTVDAAGVWAGNRGVPWDDAPTVKVAGKNLVVAGRKKKIGQELDGVPNPHLLVGLVEAVKLVGPPDLALPAGTGVSDGDPDSGRIV